jgi:hypothetical protein
MGKRLVRWAFALGTVLLISLMGSFVWAAIPGSWTQVGTLQGFPRSLVWNGSIFVAVGTDGIWSSADGIQWTKRQVPVAASWTDVAWGGGQFVAVGGAGAIVSSTNGITWTRNTSNTQVDLFAVAWGFGRWLAGGNGEGAVVRGDGVVWTQIDKVYSSGNDTMWGAASNGLVFVVGLDTWLYGFDGYTWNPLEFMPSYSENHDLIWTGSMFLGVGSDGRVFYSTDGSSWSGDWSPAVPGVSADLRAVASDGGTRAVAVGTGGTVLWTEGNNTWTAETAPVATLCAVAWGLDQVIVLGCNGEVLRKLPGGTNAYSIWVPVAAHNAGLKGSQWRSDLGMLNTGSGTANVQIKFYGSGGVVTNTTYVPAGAQSILADVVGQLGASGQGPVEILSDQPLRVTSRTYNQVSSSETCYPNGTQGQDYPTVVASDGLAAGQSAYLAGLTENASYRCNIGLVNVGSGAATVLVELYNGAGTKLTDYTVSLAAGQWAQETQPFKNKAGQTAMDRGYAKITVQSGSGVFGFASLVDNITNDPTTVNMQR